MQFAPILQHFHYWRYCLRMLGPLILYGYRIVFSHFPADQSVLLKNLELLRQYPRRNRRQCLLNVGKVLVAIPHRNKDLYPPFWAQHLYRIPQREVLVNTLSMI